MSRFTHAYLGLKACGCAVLTFADDLGDRAWTADQCAEAVRDGLTLERVTIEEARTRLTSCPHCPKQVGLLDALG